MVLIPEEQLIEKLLELIRAWKGSQRTDSPLRPVIGSRSFDLRGDEVYTVHSMPLPEAHRPLQQVICSLSMIEALIHLGYLRPSDGGGTLTFLQPTADALFLADESNDESAKGAFLATFHERYTRLYANQAEE